MGDMRNGMKKWLALGLMAVLLMACSESNKIDPRDEVVGNYTFSATGNLDFNVMGEKYSMPLEGNGDFSISKSGEKDKVMVHIFGDSVYATYKNNSFTLDEDSYELEMNEMSMEVSVTNPTIAREGEALSWDTDLRAVIQYGGMGLIGKGNVSMRGKKK